MRVYLIQHGIEPMAAEANRGRAEALARAEKIAPGSLLLLPELFSVGIVAEALESGRVEEIRREDLSWLARTARESTSWVLGSTVSAAIDSETGRRSNLSLLFDPTGNCVLEYAKVHPFTLGGEDKYFGGGEGVRLHAVEGFTLQPAICYDLRFPELFRAGMRRGADLFAVQANWPETRQEHWEVLLRARAIENQAFVAGVNCVGMQHGTKYAGGSRIASPKGELLAQAGADECVVSADLTADHVKSWRRVFPVLKDRRPEEFWS